MKKMLKTALLVIAFFDVISLILIPFLDTDKNTAGSFEDSGLFQSATIAVSGCNIPDEVICSQALQRGNGKYDFSYAYDGLLSCIQGSDIAILNQSTLVSAFHNVSGYPLYNSPTELCDEMAKIGFNVVNVAGEHILDFGEKALQSTIDEWTGRGFSLVGVNPDKADLYGYFIKEVNGLKIAIISFTDNTGGKSLPGESQMKIYYANEESYLQQMVMNAAEQTDFVIVCADWGSAAGEEISDSQLQTVNKLAEWGAGAVIGFGNGKLQKCENIITSRGVTVAAYSLGNLISAASTPSEALGGILKFGITKNITTGEVKITDKHIDGVVTHYGYEFTNLRLYPLNDYTDELAQRHALCEKYPDFSLSRLKNELSDIIQR